MLSARDRQNPHESLWGSDEKKTAVGPDSGINAAIQLNESGD